MTDSILRGSHTRSQDIPARVRAREWVASLPGEALLVAVLALVALVAQGWNMFRYPAFTLTDDEGIYASQAWAVLREGRLTPYTYVYDHAPAGWILLAGWLGVTGGPATFGGAIDGGRVLMLLLHLAMVPLLYQIARKLGSGPATAGFATLVFSLSPLAIFYQRLVLLDTIMLFWLLLSLNLLLDGWGRLSRVALSGICFGLALLSKETAIFLAPALLFIAWHQRRRHHASFGLGSWLLATAAIVSFYPLYAALKGELLPTFQFNSEAISGYASNGVSLTDALLWQLLRGGGGPFNFDNAFWILVRTDWLRRDGFLLIGGAVATITNLLRGIGLRGLRRAGLADRHAMATGLLGMLPLLYLARGGVVFNYYILFAIPFFCLNVAVLLSALAQRLPRVPSAVAIAMLPVFALGLLGTYWSSGASAPLYHEQADQPGREALAWIKGTIAPQSLIITRDGFWAALRESDGQGPAFPNAHSHWKVGADPDIRDGVFGNDWRTVDYLIMSPGLEETFRAANNTLALDALTHAHLVKRWTAPSGDEALQGQQVVELWKVDKAGPTDSAMQTRAGRYLTQHFEQNGAYPDATGVVTSEAQSYALLRAVWSGDRGTFDRVWGWTHTNLQRPDGLLFWQWRAGTVLDSNNATDADTDTALALLMAGKRWSDQSLIDEGTRITRAVWASDVSVVQGTPYLTAGNWAAGEAVVALNPSYFSPYAYRIFAEIDPQHDWSAVIDSSYRVLFEASSTTFGATRSAGLPPDWIGLDRTTGHLTPLRFQQDDPTRYTRYGYDAPRTFWRIALDERWSGDGRAAAYLKQAGFLRDEVDHLFADSVTRKDRVGAMYAHDGTVIEEGSSMVGLTGALGALLTLDAGAANALYAQQFAGQAVPTSGGMYWGNPDDLYSQEWSWFGLALYTGSLPELWHATTP